MSENEIVEIIQQTKKKVDSEYEFGLSLRQIKNIAVKLLDKGLTREEFEMALESTAKMRAAVNFSIDHVIGKVNANCRYYTSTDYLIDRVLISMGKSDKEYKNIPFNHLLESEVNDIEMDLRLDCMYSRKRAMN